MQSNTESWQKHSNQYLLCVTYLSIFSIQVCHFGRNDQCRQTAPKFTLKILNPLLVCWHGANSQFVAVHQRCTQKKSTTWCQSDRNKPVAVGSTASHYCFTGRWFRGESQTQAWRAAVQLGFLTYRELVPAWEAWKRDRVAAYKCWIWSWDDSSGPKWTVVDFPAWSLSSWTYVWQITWWNLITHTHTHTLLANFFTPLFFYCHSSGSVCFCVVSGVNVTLLKSKVKANMTLKLIPVLNPYLPCSAPQRFSWVALFSPLFCSAERLEWFLVYLN